MHKTDSLRRSRRIAALALAASLALCACRSADTLALIAEARQHRDRGDFRAAVIQLKNVLQQDNGQRDARQLLGEIYLEQGDAASAEKELRRALAMTSKGEADHLRALVGRAMLMQAQFDKLLSDPELSGPFADSAEAAALRGDALLGLRQPDKARTHYHKALANKPNHPDALLGLARIADHDKLPREADQLLQRALSANPGHIAGLRLRGDRLLAAGDAKAALASYRQILALRPKDAQAHTDISAIHSDLGQFAEARAAIKAARASSGNTLAVIFAEAMLAFRERRLPDALVAAQQLLRAAPEHPPSMLLAASIESAMGANEQAEQHLQSFLAAQPGHLFATKRLVFLYLRTERAGRALELLQPLLDKHADDVDLLALAGEAHLRARRYGDAAELFEKASALRPGEAAFRTELALSRLANGDSSRAIAELERATRLDQQSDRNSILLVMAHLRAHAHAKALSVALEMEKRADNPLVQNLKGGIFLAMGDAAQARQSFERALAFEPLYLPALANLAQLDKAAHKSEDAVRRYEAALKRDPANAGVMGALAGLAMVRGKPAEVIGWLERAVKAQPDKLAPALRLVEAYGRAGESAKALLLARQLHASHPSSPEALAGLANIQWTLRDNEAAAASYARLAALSPAAPLPHMRLAALALARGDDAAAMSALGKARALAPDAIDVQLGMLQLLIRKQKFAEALQLARSAQERQPKAPNGYKLEADLHAAQDKHALALAGYERAFGLAPSGALLIQLHGTLQKLGRKHEAEARMTRWLRDHPDDLATRLYDASSKMMADNATAAVAQFEAILRIDPVNVFALNDLAWALQRSDPKRAIEYAERAVRLAPANPSVLDTLGWIYLENGELARALPLLQKAAALAPDASEIHYHLAMVLSRSNDKPGARRVLEKLIASPAAARRHQEARALLARL